MLEADKPHTPSEAGASQGADAYADLSARMVVSNRPGEAIAAANQALALQPDCAAAFYNRGAAYDQLDRTDETIADYGKALALNPHFDLIAGRRHLLRMEECRWDGFDADVKSILDRVDAGEFAAKSFEVLTMPASPAQQKRAAEIFCQHMVAPSAPSWPRRQKGAKIRVGYFSPDFRTHAVSHLAAALFEVHDRSDFEIIGFDLGAARDDMSRRVAGACDRFIDLGGRSDVEAAALAREMDIDIAVDLAGYTQGARPNIFAARAAPIQVSYLGYPGTLGMAAMDYLIADPVLIPAARRSDYHEKIALLPCYQVNDWRRALPQAAISRAAYGLPENAFVFCGFNGAYKITPQIFDVWMRLLRKVDNSVLWLRASSIPAMANLRKEAERRGIAADRLIFAGLVTMAEHISRHQAADLFLDTFTYNAHTTASDALWAGLPVVTLLGETFPSRVTASLLTAIGLPELITRTAEEYESVALDLAAHPEKRAKLRQHLHDSRKITPLFDTARFAYHIELAYRRMVDIHDRSGAPEHFEIADAYDS